MRERELRGKKNRECLCVCSKLQYSRRNLRPGVFISHTPAANTTWCEKLACCELPGDDRSPHILRNRRESGTTLMQSSTVPPTAARQMVTFTIKPLEHFHFTRPQEWERWIRRCVQFRLASNLNLSMDVNLLNTLLYAIGDCMGGVLRSLDLTAEGHQRYNAVKSGFDRVFFLRKNALC